MSSLIPRPNGRKWICYKFKGKRHTLRLGKVSDEVAREFQRRFDRLLEYVCLDVDLPPEVGVWRSRLDDRIYSSLITSGLAPPRGPEVLGELINAHELRLIARGVKPSTLVNNRILFSNLRSYFGSERRLSAITMLDADEFRLHLSTKGGQDGGPLARATVSNRCRRARGVFAYAIKNRWMGENPFREITTGREWNHDRDHYLPVELFTKIVDTTADHELRLLLAIVRFCGLRCPSEVRPLRWAAVDWDGMVLVVHGPKNDEYSSGRREVPLFTPVLPYLYAHRERSEGELVFPSHQNTGAAITGRLATLCKKAGELLWPKPFVNMRASGERDALQAGHPIDVVAQWFGHSPEIALRHYNRVVKERQARSASGALRVGETTDDPKRI